MSNEVAINLVLVEVAVYRRAMRDPRFTIGIGVLKRADNPSKKMCTLDDQLHGKWKMLRWCLNVFEKIVSKHFHKSLTIITFRRRRLRKSICCKRSQFWPTAGWYFCMTANQHIDPNR
ncbi:hypothetical protein TNCV_1686941 [Trichonephila clavipes]|nr:hypothetical protein TNCV_1686941 [Trichonephila clavipes]